MLSTHLHLGLPSCLFPYGFPHQDPIRPPLLTHTRHMPVWVRRGGINLWCSFFYVLLTVRPSILKVSVLASALLLRWASGPDVSTESVTSVFKISKYSTRDSSPARNWEMAHGMESVFWQVFVTAPQNSLSPLWPLFVYWIQWPSKMRCASHSSPNF